MQRQVIQLFNARLVDVLRVADDAALAEARDAWAGIGPAPSCPFIGDVMRNVQNALGRGHVAREKAAQLLVSETVAAYEKLLSPQLMRELMSVIEKAFPLTQFVEFARNTKGVYQRALAPKSKYDERVFELELSLIIVSASNMSRQTVSRLCTLLNDALLRKKVNAPSRWLPIAAGFWKFIAAPAVKLISGIISTVLVAGLLAYFGLK